MSANAIQNGVLTGQSNPERIDCGSYVVLVFEPGWYQIVLDVDVLAGDVLAGGRKMPDPPRNPSIDAFNHTF